MDILSGFVRDLTFEIDKHNKKHKFVIVVCPTCKKEFKTSKQKKRGKMGKIYEIKKHKHKGFYCEGENKLVTN